jgi:hypothetical protein
VLVEGSATRGEPDVSRTGPRLEANPRPTHDQIYLLHSINERSVEDPARGLTPGNVEPTLRRRPRDLSPTHASRLPAPGRDQGALSVRERDSGGN